MRFQGAVVREHGVTFAVIIVKQHVVGMASAAQDTIWAFQPHFPDIPVVLMAQD